MLRRPWFWWLAGLVAGLVLLDGLLAVVRIRSAPSRLPERGAVDETLAGLDGSVEVVLDGHGVPHVKAGDEHDLWFVQGYLESRERFLQMELARRTAAGRMAEVVGREAVAGDVRMRTLRMAATARRQLGLLSASEQAALEAYAAGVNAAIARFGSWISPELWMLGVAPEPWRPEDSLAVACLFHFELSAAAAAELERSVQLARLGRRRAVDLWGWDSQEADSWIPPRQEASLPAQAGEPVEPARTRPGSSCWAVAPGWTKSGRPLLAVDFGWWAELPAPWFLVDLHVPGLHVAGASLPGVPGVLVGHTDGVAWALIPALVDDQDLFVVTVDGGRTRELIDDGWHPLRTVTERIAVRGAEAPELLKVRVSERGPVVRDSAREMLAMSWTGYRGTGPLGAILGMARAGSVAAVAAAWENVVGPPMHLVAADISGRILQEMVGLAPDRGRGAGRLPAPGSDSRWAWRGLLPMVANPHWVDPAEGFLAAAGHDLFSEGDAPALQRIPGEYASPWRVRRIRNRLAGGRQWDVSSTLELQRDLVSGQARTAVTILRPELERHGGRAAGVLLGWDGRMTAEGVAPHLFVRFMGELAREIGGDEAAAAGLEQDLFSVDAVLRLLAGGMEDGWWNDLRTLADEDRQAILDRVLERIDRLSLIEPWGTVHRVGLDHPLAQMALLGPLIGRLWSHGPYAVGGAADTLSSFGYDSGPDSRVTTIPSLRLVTDVGCWDETVVALAPGQSGQPWSPWAVDQLAAWLRGEAVSLPFSTDAVERQAAARLRLSPASD